MRVWDAADYSVITSVSVRDAGTPTSLSYTLGMSFLHMFQTYACLLAFCNFLSLFAYLYI
jgi:hypothetical protein